MVGFIFGGDTGETPETLKRKRSVAEALAARTSTAPKNVGEGLSAIGNALIYRALMNKVDAGDAAGRASAEADRNAFMSGYRSPVADALMPPSSKSAGIPMPGSAGEVAATSPATGDTYEPFINTIKEGGLTNPYGLAAVAATGRAESGWSAANANRTWSDPSESGQAGTAGGIMSWRGPRYQALAATGDLSPQGQAKFFLQEDPDLIAKLNNAKSLEEAQGLMNRAWAFAGYNRPGGESSRRLAYAKGYLPNFQGGSTEVASLDPSAGMSASDAINAAATPSGYVDPAVASQNAQPAPVTAPAAAQAPEFDAGRFGPRMNLAEMPPTQADIAPQLQTQTAALTGQPSPVVAALARPGSVVDAPAPVATASAAPAAVAPSQPVQSTQAQGKPQEVAQAGPGADYFPAAPNSPSQTGPSMDQIMRVLNNPYATETDKALAMSELERRQKQSDPAYQLDQRYKQAQITALERKASGENGDEWGLNPVWGKDKDGRTVLGQVSKSGKFKPLDTGDFQPTPGLDKVDTGTQIVTRDSKTGEVIGTTTKENRQEAADKAGGTVEGKSEAEAAVSLSGARKVATQIKDQIDDVLNDPNLDSAVGSIQGRLPSFRQGSIDFDKKLERLQGQAFLQAREFLKGQGQITDFESKRAEAAMVQLSTAQSEDQFRAALREFKDAVDSGLQKVEAMAGTKSGQPGGLQAPTTINSASEYEALPSGTEFIAPDGSKRRKP